MRPQTASPPARVPIGFLITLVLAIAVVVGAVRFSYGILLPPMREGLALSYTEAGLLGTVSFAGYLIGSATASELTKRWGLSRSNALAIGATAIVLALAATTFDFWSGAIWRFAAGATSGWAFVLTSSLIISRAPPDRTAFYAGIVYGGAGVGTVAASAIVSAALIRGGEAGWRWGWVLLALASAGVALVALFGRGPTPRPGDASGTGGSRLIESLTVIGAFRRPALLSILVAYFLFAAGYIIYGTFFVAYLRATGVDEGQAGQIWGVSGVLAIVSGALWGGAAARYPGRPLLVLAFAIQAASLIGPVVAPTPPVFYASAVAYGATTFGIPTILMSFTRTAVAPSRIPQAVGLFTIVFSIGQMIGPAVAGVVIDRTGAIGPALLLGAGILIGAGASLVPFLGADRAGRG